MFMQELPFKAPRSVISWLRQAGYSEPRWAETLQRIMGRLKWSHARLDADNNVCLCKKGRKKSKPQYWQNMDAEWDRTTIGRTFYQNASLFKQIPLQLFSSEQIRKNMARKRPRNFINFYLTFSFLGKLKKPAPPVCLVFIYHQSSIMWCWINRFTALKDKIKLSPQVGSRKMIKSTVSVTRNVDVLVFPSKVNKCQIFSVIK